MINKTVSRNPIENRQPRLADLLFSKFWVMDFATSEWQDGLLHWLLATKADTLDESNQFIPMAGLADHQLNKFRCSVCMQ